MSASAPQRILVVDDNVAIHEDVRKILAAKTGDERFDALRASLFGEDEGGGPGEPASYEVDVASQGEEAARLCAHAVRDGAPYRVAFVDMRMPPGWDGLRTIQELWMVDPRLEVVLCTAYSDHSLDDITRALGGTEHLLILKKPFDSVEILQMTRTLCAKWQLARQAEGRLSELSAKVQARTHALERSVADLGAANQALEHAMIEAGAASRAKSEFLTNISHELRTPLTAILGYAELLSESAADAESAEYVQIVRANGEHLLSLINDLLDLSKIEAGALRIERVPCSPRAIAEEVGKLLGVRAAQKQLQLRVRCEPCFPERVLGDPLRLRQILLNLVGNAIKFTVRGSVELLLSSSGDERGATLLKLSVTDTGIGMSPDEVQRLFQPFSQVDASTSRRFGGSGLGLSITRGLVGLLGGTIEVQSYVDQGSTFTVRLPLVSTSGESEPGAALPARVDGRALDGLHILVVEDGRDNQRLIGTFLSRAGASFDIAVDGREGCDVALAAVSAGRPHDLILMDMMMPVVDGYQATRELRASGVATPIVALTAHAMHGDQERCLQAGCDAYVTKPIDRNVLLSTCARLFHSTGGPRGARV